MAGRLRRTAWAGAGALAVSGCASTSVPLPRGHLPATAGVADVQTAAYSAPAAKSEPAADPKAPPAKGFDLPPGLPGADAGPLVPPRFQKDTPPAERVKAVTAAYPALTPVAATAAPADATPLTLADLQQMAAESSPVLRRARAEADASYGQVIQAGLHPNPTVGYQADQIQPGLKLLPSPTSSGAGQQGGYINQLIKTAGKLSLARAVAGFDYINALVAVRRAQVDVTAAVRGRYYDVLIAERGLAVNRALAESADEVYRLQLRQVAAGEAAGYEPLQLYAQAELARNALAQSEANYRAAWRRLAAAVGRPDLTPAPLAGSADAPAPALDFDALKARVLAEHTDVLTARNTVEQARANVTLQKRTPIPDISTNQYHQYDNAAQNYQFGVQVGIQVPLWDRNQGNIRTANARVGRAIADLDATENDLSARLAEAFGRYQASRASAERYRDKVIPNLTRAYRALVRRYQVEPDKVSFNDIVTAQQNLVQALQAYLTALDAQWQAVVDVANIGQLDELYPPPADPRPTDPPAAPSRP